MRALTLWPEWAALIAHGLKPVENRGWKLPEGKRIAIHAGAHIGGRKGFPARMEADHAVYWTAIAAGWEMEVQADRILYGTDRREIPIVRGAIVCTAVVGKAHRPSGKPWESADPTTWVHPLRDVVRLETPSPVARGALGLWQWNGPEVVGG